MQGINDSEWSHFKGLASLIFRKKLIICLFKTKFLLKHNIHTKSVKLINDSWINFHKVITLCNYHPDQKTEHP